MKACLLEHPQSVSSIILYFSEYFLEVKDKTLDQNGVTLMPLDYPLALVLQGDIDKSQSMEKRKGEEDDAGSYSQATAPGLERG